MCIQALRPSSVARHRCTAPNCRLIPKASVSPHYPVVLADLYLSHPVDDVQFFALLGGKPSTIGPKASRPGTDPRYCPSGEAGYSEMQRGAIRRPGV